MTQPPLSEGEREALIIAYTQGLDEVPYSISGLEAVYHESVAIASRTTPPIPLVADEELAELERLLAAATPGPWSYETDDEGSSMGWICAPNEKYPGFSGEELFDVRGDSAQQFINAALIVAAINALPGLLARIRELEAQNGPR
jgi:hypothetical protein